MTSHVFDEHGDECVRCTARDPRDLAAPCPAPEALALATAARMKLYRIDDSETHHVAARSEDEALACYRASFDLGPTDMDDVGIAEVTDWSALSVADDDAPQHARNAAGRVPMAYYLEPMETLRNAFLVCSTCY